jgi:hypothetical protein
VRSAPQLHAIASRTGAVAAVCAAAFAVGACGASEVKAARGLEIALQDDPVFVGKSYFNRDRAFRIARSFGVTRLRVNVNWAFAMSRSQMRSRTKPRNLGYGFHRFDSTIDTAARYGIRIHASLTGPAPRWATGNRRKPSGHRPNVREFERFVTSAAQYFKGRVDRYSIWNEPNWRTWLMPSKAAPGLYRALYLRGYRAIKAADPAAKVLIGETAPYRRPGFAIAPIAFLRSVACVNTRYRRRGRCPTLRADGYAHHPYDFRHSPRYRYPGRDNATMGTLGNLTRALDRLRRAGVLRFNGRGRMPLYLTEFGYFASGHRSLPPRTRSRFLVDGFQMALRNGRVRSQLQYLLVSPPRRFPWSFFDLGLVTTSGRQHPQFRALRRWYQRNRGRIKRPGGPISLSPPGTVTPNGAPGGGGGDPGGGGGIPLPPILPGS